MTTCNGCGDCCEALPLNTPYRADVWARDRLAALDMRTYPVEKITGDGKFRKMLAWMATRLTPIEGTRWRHSDGTWRWRYRCANFDTETRTCTDYANRPEVCRNYPWYGREPDTGEGLSPRCSFNADVRTTLPIVMVNGRAA